MTKFVVFLNYTPETWTKLISNPSDRTAAVRALAESVGGSLESMYFMFRDKDGFVIVDAPDSTTGAALSITVASTGAFTGLETHELIAPSDLPEVLARAGTASGSYRTPGS